MKKLATMFLSGALALSIVLAGCSGGKTQTEAEPEAPVEESETTETTEGNQMILGGWPVQTAVPKTLTDEQAELFAKGAGLHLGVFSENSLQGAWRAWSV